MKEKKQEKKRILAKQIRYDLQKKGIILEDTKEGVRWKRV
jgi:cysteinyl-tRNA synthetase